MLIAKYCKDNFSGKYAVSYAERWAKSFTNAHETGHPAPADQPLDDPMDYHNNYRGRIIFRNDAYTKKVKSFWFLKWHYKTVIKMTHNDDVWFRNNIKGKSDSALKITAVSQINTYRNSRLVYIRDF